MIRRPSFRRPYLSGKQLPVNALNPEHKFRHPLRMLTGNKPRRQNGNRYPPTDFLRRNAAAGPDAVRVREKNV